jgi:UDP-2,3-diacylglucosamine hydrolase
MAHTLFISDLHLDEQHPQSAQIFFNFIRTQAMQAQAIYILGDFFEVWVGDDDHSEFINRVKINLRQLEDHGIKVYLVRGNRDFLLGKRFAKETGCKLLPDFKTIDLYGQKVLLTHGDALCTQDERHMRFRKFSQNKILQKLCLLLPLDTRRKIGKKLRAQSKQHTQTLSKATMDVDQEQVLKMMQIYEADYLIHGHTHRPAVFNFRDNRDLQRIVLGSWERQGCALKWSSNGKQELIFFGSTK